VSLVGPNQGLKGCSNALQRLGHIHVIARLQQAPNGQLLSREFRARGKEHPQGRSALAELTVVLGSSLEVTLATTNTGSSAMPLSEALHSYFAVSDIRTVSITGLDQEQYVDTLLAGRPILKQEGPVTFDAETDRIYINTTRECVIADPGMHRSIRIGKKGSLSTVVWNPWIAKAARMPDFGDNEYPEMVCVETANCGPNALSLAPGQTHAMTTRIDVETP